MPDLNFMGGPLADTGSGVGPIILGLNWSFASVAVMAVLLRLWLRRTTGLHAEDWIMAFAAALLVVYQGLLTTSVQLGLGRSSDSVTLPDFMRFMYLTLIAQSLINLQPFFSRLSIAIFLIRIFGKARPWFKYFLITFLALFGVTAILADVLTYTYLDPFEAYWNPFIEHSYRFSPFIEYWTASALNWLVALSDLAFAILPISFVWNLQSPLVKKIGLIALFAGTFLAFFVSLARTLFGILQILMIIDSTSLTTTAVLWSLPGIEQSLVVILGTAPSLGPLTHLRLVNVVVEFLAYIFTFGRRPRRRNTSKTVNNEELEMSEPQRLSEGKGEPAKPALRFADDTLASVNDETAKYVRRGDDFVIAHKPSGGQLT